jgi:hypothetical protein
MCSRRLCRGRWAGRTDTVAFATSQLKCDESRDRERMRRGCASRPRRTGLTEPSLSSTNFLLTNARPGKSGLADAACTNKPDPFAAKTFRLEGSVPELTPPIRHRVEIAGTVEEQVSGITSISAPPAGPASVASAPKLQVESIQPIAAVCSDIVVRK